MKIGVFSDSYKPYVSGVVNSIDDFTRELRTLGHEVYIFAPRYPGYQEEEPGVFRFHSFRAPTNPDYTLAIPFTLNFNSLIKRLNLDLIHVHTPFIMGRVGAVQARRLNVPLIFTYHTLYEQYVHYVPFNQNLTRKFTVHFSRYFCNQCDLVITPTSKIRELLLDYGVKTPVEIIPSGIDIERFSHGDASCLRQKLGISPNERILLFVGRLTKEKNVDFLIRAFALVQQQHPQTVLVIVAQGPEEEHLRHLIKELGLVERVFFTGRLGGQELVNCYHGADLFVFSSVTETQGLVVVEAMAAGLPTVAVDAYGVSDMVNSGIDGLLTPYSLKAFAAGINQLLGDPKQLDSMAVAARARAQELSSTRLAQRMLLEYQEVLRRRKRVPLFIG